MNKDQILEAIAQDKVIYYDSEYCFPGTTTQTEWKWTPAKLRVQTIKIGLGDIRVIDVWEEQNIWHEIFDLLEEGYLFVAHNAIADIRPDLCPNAILKYVLNGQIQDTIYLERLIHGMSDPIGEWTKTRDSEDNEEDSEEEETQFDSPGVKKFALGSVVFRHTGRVLSKKYQDARVWLKRELPGPALQYAKDDVVYLPQIFRNQIKAVDFLNLWEIVDLNHKLLATSYLTMKYGIPINYNKLIEFRKEYKTKASDLETKLMSLMPKVSYTDTQLIGHYFKLFWQRGKGLCGLTNKTKAEQIVKKRESHLISDLVWKWVDKNKEELLHPVLLTSSQQKLEAFNRLGYKINNTSATTIKDYISDKDCPILESYLSWQKTNTLLNKILEKIDYKAYLRKDNTIKSTFTWVRALNGRSSASDMNVQQLPRELKSLYGTPPGMVKIEYDYSAIELMKMLNDYPVPELTRLILDDKEDIHVYNAARFFNQEYKDLLVKYKAGDKEAKRMRNAAKTVIYFLQYKSPKKPEDRFVTGTAKLMEIFKSDLGWDLEKEVSENLIITGESIIRPWTQEKLLIDEDISKLAHERRDLQSELLSHIRRNEGDMELAIEEGIIFFRGAKGMFYKFDVMRDNIYSPEKEEFNEETGEWKLKREYINSRSLFSCRIAGPVAIAAKSAVRKIQHNLVKKFGAEDARLGLFVHDSVTCYCKPEIKEEVERIVCSILLKEMYHVAGFSIMPVYIEGGIEGEVERKLGYHGKEILGL